MVLISSGPESMISAIGVLVLVVCVGMMEEVNSDVSAKVDLKQLHAFQKRPHLQVRENNYNQILFMFLAICN
jgi:hypothetical protein